jgi:hypothetical protein
MHSSNYLRTYTAAQLEAIAREQIQNLKKQRRLSIPVDIELIVEKLHEIQIDVQRGLKDTHHIWGMIGYCKGTGRFLILVDENLFDLDSLHHLYRMTVAEELAHSLLHGDAIRAVTSTEELQKHPEWHIHDRNAKRLAAAILIPAENVANDARAYYTELVNITGFRDPNSVKKYLVEQLAEKYDVSHMSMKFRLNDWPIKVFDKIDQAMKDGLVFLE